MLGVPQANDAAVRNLEFLERMAGLHSYITINFKLLKPLHDIFLEIKSRLIY